MSSETEILEQSEDQPALETIVSLAKRRGFVYPSAEIYGGLSASYDYGPLGVEVKRQIRDLWWQSMVRERDDIVGIEAAIITNPRVWEASGHLDVFSDPLIDCLNCNARIRADHLENNQCSECGAKDNFTEARDFNLMLSTKVGPVQDDSATAYLRPETAQGMFINFENVQTTTRKRLPFGIAQIGKSFRNEITTKQFIFRTREFEQMEMEFFCKPEESLSWHSFWKKERMRWYYRLGIRPENLRMRDHDAEELSHYSSGTSDIEVRYRWGWGELEGIAHRGDYDLSQHSSHSGKKLTYFDPDTNEHIVPHVIEPAAGVDRILLTLLIDAYNEETTSNGEMRTVLKLAPEIAPAEVAILPLSRNEKLVPTAKKIHDLIRPHFRSQYDDAQSIGRRYRRQDEIGTPLAITVDFDTLDDDAVTIRDRDTMEQVRVPVAKIIESVTNRLDELKPHIPEMDEINV